jgi:hypothetical protein
MIATSAVLRGSGCLWLCVSCDRWSLDQFFGLKECDSSFVVEFVAYTPVFGVLPIGIIGKTEE